MSNKETLAEKCARDVTPAVKKWLLAKAKLELVTEQIDEMDRRLMAEREYVYDAKWGEGRLDLSGPITDIRDLYLMEKSQLASFHERRADLIEAEGWIVESREFCPKLVAEYDITLIQHEIITAASKTFPDMTTEKLLSAGMDKYKAFIDLCVRLAVNAPWFEKPTQAEIATVVNSVRKQPAEIKG